MNSLPPASLTSPRTGDSRKAARRALGALAAALFLAPAGLLAGTVLPFDIYVLRNGDGTGTWDSTGGSVSLVQLSTQGTAATTSVVNTYAADNTGAGSVVLSKNGSANGQLLLSGDGRYLTFGGNGSTVGASTTTAGAASKVVGVFNIASGTLDTTTTRLSNTGNFQATVDVRGVYTIDGSGFWMVGQGFPSTSRGLRYATAGSTTSTALESGTPTNIRSMTVSGDGTLYVASREFDPRVRELSATNPGDTLADITTAADATFTNQTGITGGMTANVEGFAVSGNYLFMGSVGSSNNTTSGISVFLNNGSSWSQVATLDPVAAGAANYQVAQLAAYESGGVVYLFFDSGGVQNDSLNLVTFDTGTNTFGDLNVLASAGTGYTFKGIALVPIPEPATAAGLMGLASVLFLACHRRRIRRL